MEERRGDQPDAGSRPPIASAGARLSPVQEAYGDYARHSLRCPACRDVDCGSCDEAGRLYRAWRDLSNAAMDQVARKTGQL